MRTLVLGGTRSGKSAHAEALLPADAPVRYLATARRYPDDADWDARIARHVARRPPSWTTVESPDLPVELARPGPVLVDDLATWVTGLLDDAGAWSDPAATIDVSPLVEAVRRFAGDRLVLVSAEVGLGVVPPTRAGRVFRDELGALNAALAQVCDEVVLLVAGLPLWLKRA
ncbi:MULTISPECIES: bifunctional adenosylcobinamide kinase/adenosylcobinamide-phosphate guanylyltransferase [Pseudonocardia]|uniref:Adenosylcobinamide kinase n=1 Tax=Pseudonocardia oroxyli TaxID=366584 RepID=A0A1G7ZX16_PSEOR|nr:MULTISPECIES: bifunctional adenosylcobinamide kinase/adenosylcobinamide-phosphate guanylyltransferase [Pseudonocardia]MCF7548141.1 bifunctional adenosylcobinamide kinase/adenosylcobinamide-phosphate guanylyltransferase [Pseudonocardia sp. WMMC193]SDH13193.1 adenosylcobinamide kinase /adenosylcobinamide-phosphate guanylyltransferase [Pseudonocardia oroxyli]